jgi:hypothetical protein
MIKVIEKKETKTKQNPYYLLEFDYMIGDADGDTKESMACPIEDAEIVERFVKLINGLKPLSGTWGIVFDSYDFVGFLNEGQLNQEDYDFLKKVMFWGDGEDDDDMRGYFSECIRGETSYSSLVFQGVSLYYYDEYGIKHETRIV